MGRFHLEAPTIPGEPSDAKRPSKRFVDNSIMNLKVRCQRQHEAKGHHRGGPPALSFLASADVCRAMIRNILGAHASGNVLPPPGFKTGDPPQRTNTGAVSQSDMPLLPN